MTQEWKLTENLDAVALSTAHFWNLAVARQSQRILASRDHIEQQTDALLLVLALAQVLRCAELARATARGPSAVKMMDDALTTYDQMLPMSRYARDALTHFDDYARGVGDLQQPEIPRSKRRPSEELARQWTRSFEPGDGSYVYVVGPVRIDVAVARRASGLLRHAIFQAGNTREGTRGANSP